MPAGEHKWVVREEHYRSLYNPTLPNVIPQPYDNPVCRLSRLQFLMAFISLVAS